MATTLNQLIESLGLLKARKKELESSLKDTEKQIADLDSTIISALDAEGVTETKNEFGKKVAVTSSVYPQVEQWAPLENFILENRMIYLLEKRVAVLPYREMLALNRPVPGVLPFTKRKLTYKE